MQSKIMSIHNKTPLLKGVFSILKDPEEYGSLGGALSFEKAPIRTNFDRLRMTEMLQYRNACSLDLQPAVQGQCASISTDFSFSPLLAYFYEENTL